MAIATTLAGGLIQRWLLGLNVALGLSGGVPFVAWAVGIGRLPPGAATMRAPLSGIESGGPTGSQPLLPQATTRSPLDSSRVTRARASLPESMDVTVRAASP